MKHLVICRLHKIISGFVLIGILFVSCQMGKQYPAEIKHVIVIGIDGMSVQGLLEASTPFMDSMLNNGAYSYKVRSVLPTSSKPNWNAILCGAGPEASGVINNSWNRSFDEFPPVAIAENKVFPNIFRIIREQKQNAETGCIVQWSGFGDLLEKNMLNKYEVCNSSIETAQETAKYIIDIKPDFVLVHLDDVDDAGHTKGHMSDDYLKAMQRTDSNVYRIVNAVEKAGIGDNTLIMIIADHGGVFFRHGENTYEELTTPIIYSGAGVKKGYQIKQQIYKYDVAADIAFALGLKIPQVWTGRPVKAIYKGLNEPENIYDGLDILPSPIFIAKEVKSVYGGLFVDTPAEVKIKLPKGIDGEIYYTTDGTVPTRASARYSTSFFLEKSAIVNAKIYNKNGESQTTSAQYRVADTKRGNGINYSTFYLPGENKLPSFKSKMPENEGVCYEIRMGSSEIINLKNKFKADYGIRFSGWLKIDFSANYTFHIWSDGAYRLLVNSTLVTDNLSLNGSNSNGSIRLTEGIYPITVEYFTHDKIGSLDLYYEAPGMPSRVVPADKLFRKNVLAPK